MGDHRRRVYGSERAARPRAATCRRPHGALGTVRRKLEVASLVLAALALASACGEEETASPQAPAATTATTASTTTTAAPTETVTDLPKPVFATHAGLLFAASAHEYEELRPFLDKKVFLSDYGFGNDQPDPIERWKALGPEPLDTMGAILHMPHAVKETNEGTLYQWPRFDPDSEAEDIEPAEREAFLTFMTEDELVNAFIPEYGYTGPRLGILADGTWWFFLSGGAP
jgi:hypothetical protein